MKNLLKINTILHTLDSRKIGNAIIVNINNKTNEFTIKTDYGNTCTFSKTELLEYFEIAWINSSLDKEGYTCSDMQKLQSATHKHRVNINILEQANQIVNHRAEEKERQYGPFEESMEHMRDIFNSMTGLNLTTEHMYKAMIAGKFARERFSHKQDNLLDACSYIGSLNNYIENQAVKK